IVLAPPQPHRDLAAHMRRIAMSYRVAHRLVDADEERILDLGRKLMRGDKALDRVGEARHGGEVVREMQFQGVAQAGRRASAWIACSTLRKMRSGWSTSCTWKRVSASWARTDSSRAIANAMSRWWHSSMKPTRTCAAV